MSAMGTVMVSYGGWPGLFFLVRARTTEVAQCLHCLQGRGYHGPKQWMRIRPQVGVCGAHPFAQNAEGWGNHNSVVSAAIRPGHPALAASS